MYKNEKIIIRLIKYIPPIFLIFLGAIIISIVYIGEQNLFKAEAKILKRKLLGLEKVEIKDQVKLVHKFVLNTHTDYINKLKKEIKFNANLNYIFINRVYLNNISNKDVNLEKIIKKRISNYRSNNKVTISKDKNLEKYRNSFLINNKNITYTEKFSPLGFYIQTTVLFKDYEKELKKLLIKGINNFHFGKDRYVFLINYDAEILVHENKSLIGKNLLKDNHKKKRSLDIKKLISLAKKGSGYISYSQFPKPNSNKVSSKTSYIIGLDNFSWLLGTGFYHDNILEEIEYEIKKLKETADEYINETIFWTLLLTLFVLFLSIYFSKFVQIKFAQYKEEIEENNRKNKEYDKLLAHQAKMAALGEMIGNIAHQWRQPLTTISMVVHNIKVDLELDTVSNDNLEEYSTDILHQTEYLSNTIDDFRNFFKVDSTKTKFTLSEAYLNSLKIIKKQFDNNNVIFINNLDESYIYGIHNELVQVMINIFNNSLDAYKGNKIDEKRFIFVTSSHDDNDVILTIKDSAYGVDDNILERVFEPYFTTKHKSRGTGIGLYMSKEIIDKHFNGEFKMQNIEFEHENKKLKGTMSIIKIPLVKMSSENEDN